MIHEPQSLENRPQLDRTARAQAALRRGEMQVLVITDPPQEGAAWWMVASRGGRYTVKLDGDAWSCTCPDFTERCQPTGLRCKHVEAVRLSGVGRGDPCQLAGQHTNFQLSTTQKEEHMSESMPSLDPTASGLPGEQILHRLRQPLDMSRVKRRQAPGLGSVPYLEGFDVIDVANDLFQFHWSFDLLSDPHIMRWDKITTYYDQHARKKLPLLGEDGQPVTETAGVVYITGRVAVELDGKSYSHADAGRCIFTGDSPEALDMAIAGAATDCLKRCFRQLGEQFGLSLYDKEIARTAGLENSTPNHPGSAGSGPQERIPASHSSAKPNNPLSYQDGVPVDLGNAAEVEAFNAFKTANHEQLPASRDALRAWTASRNGKK